MTSADQKAERPPADLSGHSPRDSAYGLRLLFVLALFTAFAIVAGQWIRQSETRSRLAFGAARSENHALKVRQEALRAELFEVARRLAALEFGERRLPGHLPRQAWTDRGREST
ncbi:MAG: hypothetical protein ABI689_00035 [Thermoanaerobaculia bacterium]